MPGVPSAAVSAALACEGLVLPAMSDGGASPLGTWAEVKRILVEVTTSTKEGLVELMDHSDAAFDVVYDRDAQSRCPLGHFALRMALFLVIDASERVGHLCAEQSPFTLGFGVLDLLSSGWPIFGLFGLLAYRLVRDGSSRGLGLGQGVPDCSAELESFRIRYFPAAFEGEDVRFSRDVERHVAERLPGLRSAAAAAASATAADAAAATAEALALDGDISADDAMGRNATSPRCLLGQALPFLGHVASLQCLARREEPLRHFVAEVLEATEHAFLRPAADAAAARRGGVATSRALRACAAVAVGEDAGGAEGGGVSAAAAARALMRRSVLALLAPGAWAAEAFQLLQRSAPVFASHGPKPPLGGPEPHPGSDIIVSFDPNEDRFYGKGLPDFVEHAFGGGRMAGFRLRHSVPCADVLLVRDSMPSPPFPGALLYIDHEAGIGPGRDAGRMDIVLARHHVVYAGVTEPSAETRCVSRWGSAAAQRRRACAKVFSGRAPWPPTPGAAPAAAASGAAAAAGALGGSPRVGAAVGSLQVVHIPFASSSFSGRREHTPRDLGTGPRPFLPKTGFVAYMTYTCVDHRERLFDLLVDASAQFGLGAVDAMSRCAGFRSAHRRVRNHTRGNRGAGEYLDDAVNLLRPYRFALVFENKLVPGYVTEKIVNAFLAGCIPIYWGSRAVLDIFNPEAIVYANELQGAGADDAGTDPLTGLERVAAEVVRLASDAEALRRVATAPALSEAQLRRYFSWHRAVAVVTSPGGGAEDAARASESEKEDLPPRLAAALGRALSPRRRMKLCSDGTHLCEEPY